MIAQLYYTKKSQFVAGNEAEKVDVAVGHKVILCLFTGHDPAPSMNID